MCVADEEAARIGEMCRDTKYYEKTSRKYFGYVYIYEVRPSTTPNNRPTLKASLNLSCLQHNHMETRGTLIWHCTRRLAVISCKKVEKVYKRVMRCRSYRCQLVKAGEKFIEGHHQLLRRALGGQARETLDVGK